MRFTPNQHTSGHQYGYQKLSCSIHANLVWLKYVGSEVQSFENDNLAKTQSIHNMAQNESFYQISVRSWQMWYQIKTLNGCSSFVCILGISSCRHGNRSQKLIKNRERFVIFVICVILKCDLPLMNTHQGVSMVIITSLHFS